MSDNDDDFSFDVVRRGYDREQVERYVRTNRERTAELQDRIRELESDAEDDPAHDDEAAAILAERDELRDRVAKLSVMPTTVDGMSERLRHLLKATYEEVDDVRARATASATQILDLARGEAAELREQGRREDAALQSRIAEQRADLQRVQREAGIHEVALKKQMAERRAQEEAAVRSAIEKMRADLEERLAEFDAEQRAEAARIVEAAAQESRSRLAAVTAEAHGIRAEARRDVASAYSEVQAAHRLQKEVAEQLATLRTLLDDGLPEISAMAAAHSGAANGNASRLTGASS